MVSIIAETGLEAKLVAMGLQVAETLIDLFGDLAPNNPLLERMDLMAPEEIDTYRAIVRRAANAAPRRSTRPIGRRCSASPTATSSRAIATACSMTTCRAEIVAARERIPLQSAGGPAKARSQFYQPGAVNPAATVQDNVLFGRIVDTYAEAGDRVNALLRETMDALDLTGPVIELGLAFDIGSGAKRLSLAQQQKLALGRALVKRPDLLIVNRALAALDGNAQDATVTRVLDYRPRARAGPASRYSGC